MAKTRKQKEEAVVILTDKLRRAKSVVFTDYQGLTMNKLSDLRNKLSDQEAEFAITKNTLVELALKDAHYSKVSDDIKTGPTATLFAYGDEISPLKILAKALKDAQIGKIKGGFLNQEFLDAISLGRLASLPTKQELQGRVVGVLVAPLSGMVNVLQGNLRNLVYALDQIRIQKGGE
ncbi:MAG: 50S ribosomal protein L10 [Candidatus Daviesbacteria bacterium GW2011_GWA1_41_61]|uniref:Large ribosomal subunit protein uL10 n=1 Tax=Candidatus Daviesbacteria bacterium GW2011_GWA2_40_9 TaxID=1618424 RepID=A0A0G0U3G8_9BACT|nr:MAG: LSU ribosomal protein L10P, large subunit ribosomal protein L10 [Candidatus Daviesbacteria bacterium GW2011_GWC1_40_9]KKR83623.1 MAG: 50S ribosomal protein L10 [Candidatus Daviesbacteria bacterium GW2011_GWA2_40_9]KKR92718.1 MAG: 50S ribosomal protein L10 [Candidatus Daviesbacteria bacterium GW2011_GWB1_41_15]KKS14649.1 MAG: 50S ribosomal protein L10 [Candidatus Daviesbacteria bacterium GW2011_GWA1_41_61]